MTQQERGPHAGLAWTQGFNCGLLGEGGPQALALLLAAGWSALANLARGSEESVVLGQHLRESTERLLEEITRPAEFIASLLGLARQLLLSDSIVQPWPASLARVPPHPPPNLGPLQKEQANLDALQRALSGYHAAALLYAHKLGELFEAALSEYQRELAAGARPKSTSRTTRELHDRWLQIAERTYERFLGSEDYTRAVGGLMNAWADLQLALRPVMNELLLHMGLPSRHNVDDIQMHLDRLRRQQRADTARLEREITALRDELAALRGDAPGSPLKPRARRSDRS